MSDKKIVTAEDAMSEILGYYCLDCGPTQWDFLVELLKEDVVRKSDVCGSRLVSPKQYLELSARMAAALISSGTRTRIAQSIFDMTSPVNEPALADGVSRLSIIQTDSLIRAVEEKFKARTGVSA